MQPLRIDANVETNHTLTLKLPETSPVGRVEVTIRFDEIEERDRSNGPAILEFLAQMEPFPPGFWDGAAEEIRADRDSWDED